MTVTLENILDLKRQEVAEAREQAPLAALKDRIAELGRARNFFAAVVDERQVHETRIIAEIKRMSPSAGLIREDFDPVRIAQQYHEAGAAAISCVTDEAFFGGRLEFIHLIHDAVPLPILRKDFIIEEYQIWESRAAGADAVLLIAEAVDEGPMLDMMILARELGMTTLVEAHSLDELLRIRNHIGFPHYGYSLLGVNNRNLKTMKTDVSHTIRVAEFIEPRHVMVSESGITSPDDLARLRRHGVNIALVGEHLLRQPDPGEALRELLGRKGRMDLSEAG